MLNAESRYKSAFEKHMSLSAQCEELTLARSADLRKLSIVQSELEQRRNEKQLDLAEKLKIRDHEKAQIEKAAIDKYAVRAQEELTALKARVKELELLVGCGITGQDAGGAQGQIAKLQDVVQRLLTERNNLQLETHRLSSELSELRTQKSKADRI